MRKIKNFLEQNKDKFGEKKYTEVISIYSEPKEVSEFFQKSLNFNGELNNLNGKGLLELTDESIKALGLNLGQKKKLIKFINYFKTLKIETPKELILTKESKLEEVVEYLKKKLNFSEEGIKSLVELGLEGGESLLFLEESDIDNCSLTDEEKSSVKNCITALKKAETSNTSNSEKEPEITFTEKSNKKKILV